MNYDISKIKDIFKSVFSDMGYETSGMSFKCPSPLGISIADSADAIDINFTNSKNLPVATVRKLIKFNLDILGVNLGPTGGVIKIKFFPDIKFDYNGSVKFGDCSNNMAYELISQEIDDEYGDPERKKIAQRCLQYGSEWATIVSASQTEPVTYSEREKRTLRKQCYNFIYENIKNDKEIECKFVILGVLFLNFVLPVIIGWIVTKILNHWFK
jgi:hypothetical protein